MEGNPAVKEIRASGEAIDRLLSLTNTLVISASVFAILIAFAAFILIINTLRLTAYAKRKEIKIMKTLGASSTVPTWAAFLFFSSQNKPNDLISFTK